MKRCAPMASRVIGLPLARFFMSDSLKIELMPLEDIKEWSRNAKKHDLQAIADSLTRYGLRNAPIFDETLNAIVAGNGRIEALRWLKFNGQSAPRGVKVKDGQWFIPVLRGVDAKTVAEAEAFGIDDNNIVLLGGEYSLKQLTGIWDEDKYTALLTDLGKIQALPVSTDGDDLDSLIQYANPENVPAAETQPRKKQVCPNCGFVIT